MSAERRLRVSHTVMAIVILLLLGRIAWQETRINAQIDLEDVQRRLDVGVERLAIERLKSLRREELVAAVHWLDDFYRSADGLQRPGGLWRADLNKPDAEAIGVWIFDVYFQARMAGKSDDEARQAVVDQVRATDEWRRKHPKG